jgi:DNA-binding PadR family transcriptional regulator
MRSTRHVTIRRNQEEFGRYSDPPLLVLASLASGPKHGHAMIKDIVALSGTRLGPGTLYGAISRLELAGFIEPLPSSDRRQPYRITGLGARRLRAQLARLQQFTRAGIQRLKFL